MVRRGFKREPLMYEEVERAFKEAEFRDLERRDMDYLLERAIDERFHDQREAMAFIIETLGPDETIRMIREMARREK